MRVSKIHPATRPWTHSKNRPATTLRETVAKNRRPKQQKAQTPNWHTELTDSAEQPEASWKQTAERYISLFWWLYNLPHKIHICWGLWRPMTSARFLTYSPERVLTKQHGVGCWGQCEFPPRQMHRQRTARAMSHPGDDVWLHARPSCQGMISDESHPFEAAATSDSKPWWLPREWKILASTCSPTASKAF